MRVKDPARNAQICALRRSGVEPTEIASRLGLSRNVVLGVLYRSGLTDKSCPRAKNAAYGDAFREAVMARSRADGVPVAALAWGVPQNTIRRWAQGL